MALKAQVSPSTVSRVIQGNKKISETTAKKVKQAMQELNYFPNYSARNLITKKTHTIGIIIKSSHSELRQNPFYSDVIAGISQQCNISGYSTKVTVSLNYDDLYKEVKDMVYSQAIDGAILLFSKKDDPIFHLLLDSHLNFVVLGKNVSNHSDIIHIDNDNVKISQDITTYLINLGHRNILYLSENNDYEVTKDRKQGFKNAILHSKHDIQSNILKVDNERFKILDLLKTHFENSGIPTVILTSDSMLNMQVLSTIYEMNIKIPEHIQTATFNTSFITEYASPPQTSMNIFPYQLGEVSANNLLQLLEKDNDKKVKKKNIIVPSQIVIRQSTQNIGKKEF